VNGSRRAAPTGMTGSSTSLLAYWLGFGVSRRQVSARHALAAKPHNARCGYWRFRSSELRLFRNCRSDLTLWGFLPSAASSHYGLRLLFVYAGYIPLGYSCITLLIAPVGGAQFTVLGIIGIFGVVKLLPRHIVEVNVGRRP
jgi:hypothetical protein